MLLLYYRCFLGVVLSISMTARCSFWCVIARHAHVAFVVDTVVVIRFGPDWRHKVREVTFASQLVFALFIVLLRCRRCPSRPFIPLGHGRWRRRRRRFCGSRISPRVRVGVASTLRRLDHLRGRTRGIGSRVISIFIVITIVIDDILPLTAVTCSGRVDTDIAVIAAFTRGHARVRCARR